MLKTYVSHYYEDVSYKNELAKLLDYGIVHSQLSLGNVNFRNSDDFNREELRNGLFNHAQAFVVLLGPKTWSSAQVDWEIGVALTDTECHLRCGVVALFLPEHPDYFRRKKINPELLPPRLADNCLGKDPYVQLHNWIRDKEELKKWMNQAHSRKARLPYPQNNRPQLRENLASN